MIFLGKHKQRHFILKGQFGHKVFGITNKTYVQFICTGPSRTGLNYVVRASDIKFPSARVYALLQYFIRINLGNLEYNVLLVLYKWVLCR